MFANEGLLTSDATMGSCVQLRMEVESMLGVDEPVIVKAVPFWKNSSCASRGAALLIWNTPLVLELPPNWNSTWRTTHWASTAVSLNSIPPTSPVCGVLASLGVVSPPKPGLSSRREVTMIRPVVLLLPTMLRAPEIENMMNAPVGLSTTCGSTVSVTPLGTVIVPVGRYANVGLPTPLR